MADVEIGYKGATIGTLNNTGSLTLETAGTYVEDDITVDYTKSGGGGGSVKIGALRPDAELWKSWSYDKMIVADEGMTIPAYSTTAVTFRAIGTLDTVTLATNDYFYLFNYRALAIPQYNDSTPRSSKQVYSLYAGAMELRYVAPSEFTTAGITPSSSLAFPPALSVLGTVNLILLFTSSTTIQTQTSNQYGCRMEFGNAYNPLSLSGSSLSINYPLLGIRGNNSYFGSAAWGQLTDIRYQYIYELWRVPITTQPHGFTLMTDVWHITDCVNNNNGKLT